MNNVISEEDINLCPIPGTRYEQDEAPFLNRIQSQGAMAALKEEMAYSQFFEKNVISVQIAFARISGSSQPELPYLGIALWRGGSRYIRLASRSCASSFLGTDNSRHHP